tara:strand:+ start:3194 stop:3364 length:171 start_codon:yes stop_codon:yes gene_type:complete
MLLNKNSIEYDGCNGDKHNHAEQAAQKSYNAKGLLAWRIQTALLILAIIVFASAVE